MWNKNMLFRGFNKLNASMGIAVILMLPCKTFAALWQLTPSIILEERYDDNIRLTTAPHDSVTGTLLKGNLEFSRLTEISGITGRVHLNFSDYSGDEEVANNNDVQYFTLASHYKTERARWRLNGSLKRATTLRGIDTLQDTNNDQSDDDVDEGLVNIDIRRYQLKLRPSWNYSLSERTNLNLLYDYTDVRYEDNRAGSGLFNYKQNRVRAGVSHKLSERDIIKISSSLARFKSPRNNDNEVDSYSLTAGYQRQFSETTSGDFNVGINHSSQINNVLSSAIDNDGYVFRLKLNHKTELDRYTAELTHDLQPSGSGNITEANQFKLNFIRKFSNRLTGRLDARYIERKAIDSSSTNKSRYFSIAPRISWKLTRWWTLAGGYKYRNNRKDSNADTADSNAVFVSLAHRKPITFD